MSQFKWLSKECQIQINFIAFNEHSFVFVRMDIVKRNKLDATTTTI